MSPDRSIEDFMKESDQREGETAVILIKPDGVHRKLVGEIISRYEKKGLNIIGIKMIQKGNSELFEQYFIEHKDKAFYPELMEFITSGPSIVIAVEGHDAIEASRQILGRTNPMQADAGTVRGDFAIDTGFNVIGSSDNPPAAERDIKLFFNPQELHQK